MRFHHNTNVSNIRLTTATQHRKIDHCPTNTKAEDDRAFCDAYELRLRSRYRAIAPGHNGDGRGRGVGGGPQRPALAPTPAGLFVCPAMRAK